MSRSAPLIGTGTEYASEYLRVAVRASRAGGKILRAGYGRLRPGQIMKKGRYDWVTAMDHRSERAILKVIRGAFPDHLVQAEESAPKAASGRFVWLIDPLDGTVNYLHGFPMFAVSIGLAVDGRLEAGVVYDPVREEMFTARRGHGAFLNGRRIRISGHSKFEGALLATGFPFRAQKLLGLYLRSFRKIFIRTGNIRRPGSAAMDLAYTACGRMDGFWEMSLSPWDMAAGALLIEEAGGKVSDFFGEGEYLERGHIVAAAPRLQPEMVKILKPIFRGKIP